MSRDITLPPVALIGADVLADLKGRHGYPSVSILLPTHRTHPDNKQDPIVLKNLHRDAVERLQQEFSKREAQALLDRLAALVDGMDHDHNLDGLGLFASQDFARAVRLPFAIEPRVQIDDRFALRDLVKSYNRTPHYYTLVLSEKPTRLFACFGETFEESRLGKFPLEHGGPGGASRLPGGHGVNASQVRDIARRDFVRAIDEELDAVLRIEELPVMVTGVENFLADFQKDSRHQARVMAFLQGSYDYASAPELAQLVWPVAKEALAERRRHLIASLDDAVGAGKSASGIVQVWQAAHEGRVDLLVAEEDYRQPAILGKEGALPTLIDDPTDPRAEDDLVDVAVLATLENGGRAIFADPGTLARHDRVAAVLRY